MKDTNPSGQQKHYETSHPQSIGLHGRAGCLFTSRTESESTRECVVHSCIEALLSCNHLNHLERILQMLTPSLDFSLPLEEANIGKVSSKENIPIIRYASDSISNDDMTLFLCKSTSWARLRSLAQLMSDDGCSVFGVAYPFSCCKGSSTLYVWNLHPCTANHLHQQHKVYKWFWIPNKYSRSFQILVTSRLRLFSENMICKEHHGVYGISNLRVIKLVLECEDDALLFSGKRKSNSWTEERFCELLSSIYPPLDNSSSAKVHEELCEESRENLHQHGSTDASSSKVDIIDMDLSQLKREVKSEVEDTTTQECDASVLYVDVTKSSEAALSRLHIKNKEKVSLVCPKAQCRKQYVHRHKGKLLSHIMRFHMNDPEHNELMAAFRQLFPERNKTPRKACELCGKLIAGRGAQMRKHQGKSGCKFFRK